jgi:hypothetical protein
MYGTSGLLARLDQVDAPPHPKCIGREVPAGACRLCILRINFIKCKTVTEQGRVTVTGKNRRGKMMGRVELLIQTIKTPEYTVQSVRLPLQSSELAPPASLTHKRVLSPLVPGGEAHSIAGEGAWESQFRTKGQTLWYLR